MILLPRFVCDALLFVLLVTSIAATAADMGDINDDVGDSAATSAAAVVASAAATRARHVTLLQARTPSWTDRVLFKSRLPLTLKLNR